MSIIYGQPITFGGSSDITAPVIGKDFTWTGGDGTYQVLDDGDKNWRIKFLSSGVFTPLKTMAVDVFLVGGGGSGTARGTPSLSSYGSGGGGGYTVTEKSRALIENIAYDIVVGAGGSRANSQGDGNDGGQSTAFSITANGGKGALTSNNNHGGDGGSGGGVANTDNKRGYDGGSDGSNGKSTGSSPLGGRGQGTTTREFGESDGTLYAGGGGGYYKSEISGEESVGSGGAGGGGAGGQDGVANTGGGAGSGGEGGSGIVVIRKHKEAAA